MLTYRIRPARLLPAPTRRRPGRLARIALAATVLATTIGIAPAGAGPAAAIGNTTFYGRGYGHGVGMSQYGARGRALAGQLAPEILSHYYAGTALGQRDPTTLARVLVLSGFAASTTKPLTVRGIGGAWSIDGVAGTFPKSARLTLAPTTTGATTWKLTVTSGDGLVLTTAVVTTSLIVRPATTLSYLELTSKPTTYNLYRGYLRIRLTTTATVYDHVALDLYLRGVVPVEMPTTWPAEALNAQAIASRSYAVYRLHPTIGSFDLYDDTRSQVYRGRRAETVEGNSAVAATSGTVLLSGTTVANTLYHSADGGWTENNENVFVSSTGQIVAGPLVYLRGSSDRAPNGSSYDAASPFATWHTATYTAAALSAIFAKDARTNVGAITSIDLSHRGVSGRLISVTLIGALGTKTVSGSVFITAFNAGRPATDPRMRDTLFSTAPIP
jgi:stage II sporulation protein D